MTTPTRSLARNSAIMAAGSFVSRLLGVVRAAMILAVLGRTVAGDAWQVANTLPNTVYLLLAGGVLNAVLVPQITKAQKQPDGGRDFVDRLLTLALLGTALITAICIPTAPLLVKLFSSGRWSDSTFQLSVSFAYICLPAIFFYGLYTILGQVLNAQERFGAYMWAPVLCNIVWIIGLGYFLLTFGTQSTNHDPASFTPEMILVLGGSLLLGVALQALVLIIPLWRSGFRYRPRLGFRGVGLRSAGTVAMWTFAAVAVSQVGLIVQSRVLTSVEAGDTGRLPYDNAFLLFMTPHGLITVSVVTALFTIMSKAASAGDVPAVRAEVRRGLTLTGVATVPVMIGSLILGPALTAVIFLGNNVQTTDATAYVMIAMMLGLPSFGGYYVIQRAFYAFEDARTPFDLQLINTGVAMTGALLAYIAPSEFRAIVVGLGQATSNIVCCVVGILWLRRKLEVLPLYDTVRTVVRVHLACVPGALAAGLTVVVSQHLLPWRVAAVVSLIVGGTLFLWLYVGTARRMRVRELDDVLAPLLRRVPGLTSRWGRVS